MTVETYLTLVCDHPNQRLRRFISCKLHTGGYSMGLLVEGLRVGLGEVGLRVGLGDVGLRVGLGDVGLREVGCDVALQTQHAMFAVSPA